jgi:hypothetical protein
LDWWNIKAEHTAYEWACQYAMWIACPFGERRKDIRAAFHTGQLISMQMKEALSEADFSVMVNGLSRYLACDKEQEDDGEAADMDALALMIKQQEGR